MRTADEIEQGFAELDHDMEKFIQRFEDSEGFGRLVGQMLRNVAVWYTDRALDHALQAMEADSEQTPRDTINRLRTEIRPKRISVQ